MEEIVVKSTKELFETEYDNLTVNTFELVNNIVGERLNTHYNYVYGIAQMGGII